MHSSLLLECGKVYIITWHASDLLAVRSAGMAQLMMPVALSGTTAHGSAVQHAVGMRTAHLHAACGARP